MCEIYDYKQAVTDDLIDYLAEGNLTPEDADIDQLVQSDFITGAGSGSYTMDRLTAELNLVGNLDLLRKAVDEIAPDFDLLKSGPEVADVIIRQYLVPEIFANVIRQF